MKEAARLTNERRRVKEAARTYQYEEDNDNVNKYEEDNFKYERSRLQTCNCKVHISGMDAHAVKEATTLDREFDSDNARKAEQEIYDEVYAYLSKGEYPLNYSKQDKNSLRKRAKNFQVRFQLQGRVYRACIMLHFILTGD